jgi:hypothetical protein
LWHVDDLAIIAEHEVWIFDLDHIASTQHATRSVDTARFIVALESELAWHPRGRGRQDEAANGTRMRRGLRVLGVEWG